MKRFGVSVLVFVLAAATAHAQSARVRGRLMSDVWATSSDLNGIDYPSGTEIRVAVLGVEGRLNPLLTYRLEVDLSNESPSLRDAWLRFGSQGPLVITLGNFKPPFSLEHLGGLPRGVFLEPALPNVFALSESIGIQLEKQRSNWYVAIAAFGEPPSVSVAGDEGYGIAARWSFLPWLAEARFVHLGVSGYHKFLNAAGRDFRIRQRPEVRIFGTRLADTGSFEAESTQAFVLELAVARGRFSAQAEYMENRVEFVGGEATFNGGYLLGSWLLTGETRPYRRADRTIARVEPRRPFGEGGSGALELALRYSTLDLNDSGIVGGEEDNATFGVNWYFAEYARLMLNYVRYDLEDSRAVRPFGSAVHSGDALGIRAQVDW